MLKKLRTRQKKHSDNSHGLKYVPKNDHRVTKQSNESEESSTKKYFEKTLKHFSSSSPRNIFKQYNETNSFLNKLTTHHTAISIVNTWKNEIGSKKLGNN